MATVSLPSVDIRRLDTSIIPFRDGSSPRRAVHASLKCDGCGLRFLTRSSLSSHLSSSSSCQSIIQTNKAPRLAPLPARDVTEPSAPSRQPAHATGFRGRSTTSPGQLQTITDFEDAELLIHSNTGRNMDQSPRAGGADGGAHFSAVFVASPRAVDAIGELMGFYTPQEVHPVTDMPQAQVGDLLASPSRTRTRSEAVNFTVDLQLCFHVS